jgi:hypothetical protein
VTGTGGAGARAREVESFVLKTDVEDELLPAIHAA